MRLIVSLGGYSTKWIFEGSASFEGWLGDGRWMDEGGVRLVRVPSREHFARFGDTALRSLIASSFRNDARTFAIDFPLHGRESINLESHFLRLLGIEQSQREYQRLHDAARMIDNRPTVFLIRVHENTENANLQCIQFLERIEKVGGLRRPTIVELVADTEFPFQTSYDFLRGFPENLELLDKQLDENQVWQRYLHLRIAWETSGDLAMAEAWEARHAFRKIPKGNDDLLENRLNFASTEQFATVNPKVVELLSREIADNQDLRLREGPNAGLLEATNLFWRSGGANKSALSSWAARAILQKQAVSKQSQSLRGALRCTPLATDLLRTCFAFEFHERAICYNFMPPEGEAKDETQRLCREFKSNHMKSVRRYYPIDCLAGMLDTWHFASFGEIIAQVRSCSGTERHKARYVLLNLRNALSHGHYPCWKMVSELRELTSLLS